MRTRIKVTGMSTDQWDRLQLRAKTEYEFTPGIARVCVVFELAPQTERHVEMPVHDFALLLSELHLTEVIPDADIYSGGSYAYDGNGLTHFPLEPKVSENGDLA